MSDNDLKKVWQSQGAGGEGAFPVETLRRGATQFQRRVARRNAIEYAACVAAIACFGYYLVGFPFLLMRAGSLLMIAATLAVAWQLRARAASAPAPADFGARSWLEFHRTQLARQRDALRTAWLWYVAPFVPGLVVFRWGVETELGTPSTFARGLWANLSIAAVFALVVIFNRFVARRCQRQLDMLPPSPVEEMSR
jgi:hypothetical protein